MMKRLSHSSLPEVVDVIEDGETVCLVLEYIPGKTLEECIQGDRRLSRGQVMDAALQIGGALAYLHGRREPILHLDLKPSNIILRSDGRLCLMDFGAAQKVRKTGAGGSPETIPVMASREEKAAREAIPSERRGTPGYAAPEQYDMDAVLDERTDVYGLGAVLYRLISGKKYSPCLQGSHIPGCDEGLAAILRKCLQIDPDARYASAREVCRDVRRLKRSKDREQSRIRGYLGMLLLLPAFCLASFGVKEQLLEPGIRKAEYQACLQETLTAREEDLLPLYKKAILLAPARKEAWLSYLEWKGRDGILSEEEDREIRNLLHTIPVGTDETLEETLTKRPSSAGEVFARLGLMYWFDFAGTDGKRIGQGYFAKAVQEQNKLRHDEIWGRTAEIFSHIGTYVDTFRTEGSNDDGNEAAVQYWEDTGKLLEEDLDDLIGEEQLSALYESCAARLAMDAGKLSAAGVTRDEMLERLQVLNEKKKSLWENTEQNVREKHLNEINALENSLKQAGTVVESLRS